MIKSRVWSWTARLTLVGVALLNMASAQESTAPAEQDDAPNLESGATDEVQLTPQQMRAAVPDILNGIAAAEMRLLRMQSEAKTQGDVSKVLCLDPILGEIQLAHSAAKDRGTELSDALERGDMTRARFSFNLLTVVKDRVEIVVGRANRCIGEETGFTGDSEVEVEVDPSLPENDANQIPDVPVAVLGEPNVESATE